jgi:hypothetical protein
MGESAPAPVAGRAQVGTPALDGVSPGLWSVQDEESGGMIRRLCLGDPANLVQVRHAGASCSRMVIASAPHEATIQYSCPGNGWGRTSLRVDSATSVRIDTQGIADNAPFAYQAVARREGDCPASSR